MFLQSDIILLNMSTTVKHCYQKCKEVVATIFVRQEPAYLVLRVHNIPEMTMFNWLALYRSGGWNTLKENAKLESRKKLFRFKMQCMIKDNISPLLKRARLCTFIAANSIFIKTEVFTSIRSSTRNKL